MSLFNRYGQKTTKDHWFRGEETLSREWKQYSNAMASAVDGQKFESWESWLARNLNTNNSLSHHEIQTAFNQRKENPRTNYLSHGKRGGVVTRTKPFVGDELLSVDEWCEMLKSRQYDAFNAQESQYINRTQIQQLKKINTIGKEHKLVWPRLEGTYRNMTQRTYQELQRGILQPVIQQFEEKGPAAGSQVMRFYKENSPVEFEAICQYKALQAWVNLWGGFNQRSGRILPSGECGIILYSYQYNTYLNDFADSKKEQYFTNMRAIDHTIPEPNWELLEAHQRMVNTSYSGRKQRIDTLTKKLASSRASLNQWTDQEWVTEYLEEQVANWVKTVHQQQHDLATVIAEKDADAKVIASL